ncbi:class A beta-lactamase-related serine hydrolase [Facklamia sp. 7083-14-GEN3]|uniref:class A beta-lactamase-related serine hydrolase n=1 Tax=Facklamia sp. 7083-14-GEN3 TaxID=2973478 RepID=UPI00215BCEAE|nr:class A beta-lactamase-related serine hydrolase [Facklamia sp. 7083-14-GEN3]MCR8969530.1 class A beta-lactamase-related serine hydrolase [Facklamia sp. 7083-14-GEN3]
MNDSYQKQLLSFLITATLFSTLYFTFISSTNRYLIEGLFKKPIDSSIDFESVELDLTQNPILKMDFETENVSLSSELTNQYMPRFYNRPQLIRATLTSPINRNPIVEEVGVAELTWKSDGLKKVLYQENLPFTGWFQEDKSKGYYQEGLKSKLTNSELLMKQVEDLFAVNKYPFYMTANKKREHFTLRSIEYSILIKSSDLKIYSDPPGVFSSRYLQDTQEMVDSPMEVTQELTNQNGTWLHVYFGYDELGWIRKDSSYNEYVLTHYSERELLDDIEDTLETYLGYVSATAGASFVNSEHLTQVSVNNKIFFPASTQKIYVLGKIYDLYKSGDLSPSSLVILSDENRVPGAGIIQGEPSGSQYTVDYLVDLIALYSDNTAANMLIEVAGEGEWITPFVHKFDLKDTFVDGKYYHGSTNRRFQTSPGDAARYFALMARNELNGEPWDEQLIQKLMMNPYRYLSLYMPYVITWNKTGVGSTEQNDVAAFQTDYGTYTIAVYTENPYNYDAIPDQIGILSKAVYDVYISHRSLLWEKVTNPQEYLEAKEQEMLNSSAENMVDENNLN